MKPDNGEGHEGVIDEGRIFDGVCGLSIKRLTGSLTTLSREEG